jgi:hypothetical protein
MRMMPDKVEAFVEDGVAAETLCVVTSLQTRLDGAFIGVMPDDTLLKNDAWLDA